jgi:hypothetical protein
MSRLTFILVGILTVSPVYGGQGEDVADIFNQFDAREQRIIYAITADPDADGEFGSALGSVIGLKNKPAEYEVAKQKFQLEWLGRIKKFSDKYRGGDADLKARMAQIPKPSLSELIKKEKAKAAAGRTDNVAWFIDYDAKKWKGELLPALWKKSDDPHLLEYNIAGMRSMDPAQKAELFKMLAPAETWLSADSTAVEIFKASKKEFNADLGNAGAAYASRSKTVKDQLAKLEGALKPTLVADAGNKTVEELASQLQKGYDGGTAKDETSTTPVDTRTSKIAPGKIVASKKGVGALTPAEKSVIPGEVTQAAKKTKAPPSPVFSLRDSGPAPKQDKEYGKAAPKSGGGSKIAAALKSPKIAGIGGGLLGAIAGFFLGGPIGALIGAVAGAALGAGVSGMLNK